MIRRVVSLTGTAMPRPTPATAVLTPTTRPSPSASAPPELPGLSAASVWITFSTSRPADPARVGRELGGREIPRVGVAHGQVRERIGSDDLRAELAAVRERGCDAIAAGDHVG